MSKSSESPQGTIALLDPPELVTRRLRAAVTDSGTEVTYDPAAKPGVANLLEILAATTGRAVPTVEAEFAGRGYAALKQAVADAVIECLAPLQARYAALVEDPTRVDAALATGAEKAESFATKVLARTRQAVGLLPRA
jgi:tryptophanyl-tRNA synthetase